MSHKRRTKDLRLPGSLACLGALIGIGCTVPSGVYLCDDQGRCPTGFVCEDNLCYYEREKPAPPWVETAQSGLEGKTAYYRYNTSEQLLQLLLSDLPRTELCGLAMSPNLWPESSGLTFKLLTRIHFAGDEIVVHLSNGCGDLADLSQLDTNEACAWLMQREETSQSLTVVDSGRIDRTAMGISEGTIRINVFVQDVDLQWEPDFVSCQ